MTIFVVSCRFEGSQEGDNRNAPTATIVPTVEQQGSNENVDPVLAACPPDLHQRVLKEGVVKDLEGLGLDTCYDLELTVNDTGDAFEASARVTVRNGSETPWPSLLFRLYPAAPLLFGGSVEVERVEVDGSPVEATRTLTDESGLHVPLASPLAAGESAVVTITYAARLATDLSEDNKVYGIFARGEESATMASWFPLLAVWDNQAERWQDEPVLGEGDAVVSETALIQATLVAPAKFDLAASGLIVEEKQRDEHKQYRVVTGPARDMTVVWIEDYEVEEIEVDGTLLRNWYRSGDEEGAELALEAARQSLEIFNRSFGPYPFRELDIAAVPLRGAGGVEYPQLFLLGAELYPDPRNHQFLAFASAHEMAHQWWYSLVGNDVIRAPWQDEALANWSAVYWVEQARGEEAGKQILDNFRQGVRRYESQQGEGEIDQPLQDFQGRNQAYGALVYLKGALFVEALREQIGDDAFFQALQSYYETHRFEIADPGELLTTFERSSGQSLAEFYAEWNIDP